MDSQFAALEPPRETEQVIVVDATGTVEQMATEIIDRFGLAALADGA